MPFAALAVPAITAVASSAGLGAAAAGAVGAIGGVGLGAGLGALGGALTGTGAGQGALGGALGAGLGELFGGAGGLFGGAGGGLGGLFGGGGVPGAPGGVSIGGGTAPGPVASTAAGGGAAPSLSQVGPLTLSAGGGFDPATGGGGAQGWTGGQGSDLSSGNTSPFAGTSGSSLGPGNAPSNAGFGGSSPTGGGAPSGGGGGGGDGGAMGTAGQNVDLSQYTMDPTTTSAGDIAAVSPNTQQALQAYQIAGGTPGAATPQQPGSLPQSMMGQNPAALLNNTLQQALRQQAYNNMQLQRPMINAATNAQSSAVQGMAPLQSGQLPAGLESMFSQERNQIRAAAASQAAATDMMGSTMERDALIAGDEAIASQRAQMALNMYNQGAQYAQAAASDWANVVNSQVQSDQALQNATQNAANAAAARYGTGNQNPYSTTQGTNPYAGVTPSTTTGGYQDQYGADPNNPDPSIGTGGLY